MSQNSCGTLYIVATPIGNLEDMTFRAVRTLKEVDLIAAEDTRHSRKLLNHYGIATRMTPYHDHNEQLKTDYLIERLMAGENVAIITDAGTPCIADPGYRVAKAASGHGIRIVPIPGASAITTALSASGLPSDRFIFEGFLPPKQGKRKSRLLELKIDTRVIILYEAPHRLIATLTDINEIFGDCETLVVRELTKMHEEFRRGTPAELLEQYAKQPVKGEIVILISPAEERQDTPQHDIELMIKSLLEDHSLKDTVTRVSAETERPRTEIYAIALAIKNKTKF
ncbi:MAG: 16S rRNA (cytidine(1402)-2'-O)-methyltransferase [Geobacteraceae bacterium]|nr:16S rRNA (cytidine(1402)-2'-O)-methyltransferase [Geobacteraceae bacterium]